MQGPKKTPYSSIRRDDRAEPDDEQNPHSTPRIDVVNVDGPGTGQGIPSPLPAAPRSEVAQGIMSLRAQLKSLNDQAAAVERSLDEQRRDRADALDRLERATERCIDLETKISTLEIEAAELKEENAGLTSSLEESMRAAAAFETELTDVRKRQFQEALKVTDLEGEVGLLKKRLEAAASDLETAQAAETSAQNEAKGARDEAMQAREAAGKAESAIGVAKTEASRLREEAAKLRDEQRKLKEDLEKAKQDTDKARQDAEKAKQEAGRTKNELDRAKEDNVKDRATARDRIDLLERALDDARAQNSRTETALEQSRENEDTMGRQLEAAMARAADAKARAESSHASQHALEQNVRRLRESIAKAFAKIGHGADKPPVPRSSMSPPSVAANDQEAEEITAEQLMESIPPLAPSKPPGAYSNIGASLPPVRPVTSVAPNTISGVPPVPTLSGAAVAAGGPPLDVDGEWASPDSVPPAAASSVRPSQASPASKSVPPPPPSPQVNGVSKHDSIPPPTYASVPPQVHAQAYEGSLDEEETKPNLRVSEAPETRRGGMSSFPVPSLPHNTQASTPPSALTRDELLARLVDPVRAAPAAAELKLHPEWLTSVPPPSLVHALQSVDYDADRPVFDLARQWEREALCHALIGVLRSEPEARLREHAAWLLKHLAAPSSWKAIADLSRSEDEGIQLRRWLLEALDRLAAGRGIGWREIGEVCTVLAKHPDASLRDGVVGILVSLDRSDEKRRLLLEILRADDDEIVLASAVDALAGALPVELDPNLVERLLGHPSARVQRSVRDLIERSKRS